MTDKSINENIKTVRLIATCEAAARKNPRLPFGAAEDDEHGLLMEQVARFLKDDTIALNPELTDVTEAGILRNKLENVEADLLRQTNIVEAFQTQNAQLLAIMGATVQSDLIETTLTNTEQKRDAEDNVSALLKIVLRLKDALADLDEEEGRPIWIRPLLTEIENSPIISTLQSDPKHSLITTDPLPNVIRNRD